MEKEQFVMISKIELDELKKENEKLKEEVSSHPKSISKINTENDKFVDKIISEIRNENKKERELILSKLESVDKMSSIMKEFSSSVNELVSAINAGKVIDNFDSDKLIKEVKEAIALNNDLEINAISDKLDKVEEFMENLKILLSQIDEKDMKVY